MKLKSLVALKITVPGIACVQSVLMAASKVGKGILRIVVDGQQKLETPAIKDLDLMDYTKSKSNNPPQN